MNAQLEAPVEPADEEEDEAASDRAAFSKAMQTLTQHGVREGSQQDGLEKAKNLMRALVAQGHTIITQRQYVLLGDFYKVILQPSREAEQFAHSQSALIKLALFVAEALREGRAKKEPKPLVMAAPRKAVGEDGTATFLVVAVLGSARHWQSGGRNSFGNAFHAAATDERVNARVAVEAFDSTICYVAQADLENFMNGVVMNYTPG